ncbi:hypothetical protein SKAU_G00035570 [Synaphobranchus kaupii]|uniref:Uncharacterized protein n=1 Tax=Synaphobranchus kaupii TaxID=118154 RepID=A0A9Q1GG74_SYNKA|nr:hypothetical protein SKAU_G00035570 [Synaphobranchus kaupii]
MLNRDENPAMRTGEQKPRNSRTCDAPNAHTHASQQHVTAGLVRFHPLRSRDRDPAERQMESSRCSLRALRSPLFHRRENHWSLLFLWKIITTATVFMAAPRRAPYQHG